jgi:hypothetical protein
MDSNESMPGIIRISISDQTVLRVRAQQSDALPLPEFLYQKLPTEAMAIMATIPTGDIRVSIPHQRNPGFGYLIDKTYPAATDGFFLIYALQPNRQYEAIRVSYQNKIFEVAQFYNIAASWTEAREGNITAAPGRYVYLSPNLDEWGVILRDSGYIAVDPSQFSSSMTVALKAGAEKELASGVFVRMPLYAGDKHPHKSALPSFSRVELTLDRNPGNNSRWMSFDEYRNERAGKSRPPEIIVRSFREWAQKLAEMSGFESWIFPPGTLFADPAEWWGDRNQRRTEHEGIDFAQGRRPDESVQNIPTGTPVCAIADGEIISILADFLDRTVIVRHPEIRNADSAIFHTLYSHIQPEKGLFEQVSKADRIGIIGEPKSNRAPMHLHLTAAWIPPCIRPEELTMSHINLAFAPIVLVDFGVPSSELKTDRGFRMKGIGIKTRLFQE